MISNICYLVLFLGLAQAYWQSPKVLSFPIRRNPQGHHARSQSLVERDSVATTLSNNLTRGGYYMNITIGTPGQLFSVQLDTGSSDLWVHSTADCAAIGCDSGGFNMSESSTATMLLEDGFNITYGTAGSYVYGNYIQDDMEFSGTTVKNLTMGISTKSSNESVGILGVGFDVDESWVSNTGDEPYANFIDTIVSQNIINTRAYSLYLDDLEASTGQILFGGYDTEKFSGDLYVLDIQPDSQTDKIMSMTVALNSIGVEREDSVQYVTSDNTTIAALLDSGTSLIQLPSDWFSELFNYFEGEEYEGSYIVDCSLLSNTEGTLNFGFGDATIKVPFSELAIPQDPIPPLITMSNGDEACQFGITTEAVTNDLILGDMFLRSAYVVYDLDNEVIGIAQTVFNSTKSNIQELGTTGVSGTTVSQSATPVPTLPVPTTATGTLTGSLVQATGASSTSSTTISASSATPTSSANMNRPKKVSNLVLITGSLSIVAFLLV